MSKDSNKRRTVTVTHNGFHGRRTVRFRPRAITYRTHDDGRRVMVCEVSARTARRLNREACGHQTCKCYEYIAEAVYDGLDYSRPYSWCVVVPCDGSELRGNYPQGW